MDMRFNLIKRDLFQIKVMMHATIVLTLMAVLNS